MRGARRVDLEGARRHVTLELCEERERAEAEARDRVRRSVDAAVDDADRDVVLPEEGLIHKQMVSLNPNDNQAVRYLIGPESLRVGDNDGAIEAFQKSVHEEVGCAFGLALAKLRAEGPSADIGEALLIGFAANRYVTPMLLGESWERLDAFHRTSMAEPEWARDVIAAQADLWQTVPRGVELLRFWSAAPPVATWRRKLDEIMLRLKDLAPSSERSALVSHWSARRSEGTIRELVQTVRTAS